MKIKRQKDLTSSFLFHLFLTFGEPPDSFFFLLFFSTSVEILDDDSDEHVEYEKSDEKNKRNEVQKPPLAVVLDWLNILKQDKEMERKRK